jgi:hypothetical protein
MPGQYKHYNTKSTSSWRVATSSTPFMFWIRDFKRGCGKGASHSWLQHIVETTSPVKNKKEEEVADHSILCE